AFNKVLPIPPGGALAGRSPSPLVPPGMGTEAPTVSIPATAGLTMPPLGGGPAPLGIPPLINAPPVAYPPRPFGAASFQPGVPPVIQDARLSSSGMRRGPPPGLAVDTESPTVADREGSAGAFGAPLA